MIVFRLIQSAISGATIGTVHALFFLSAGGGIWYLRFDLAAFGTILLGWGGACLEFAKRTALWLMPHVGTICGWIWVQLVKGAEYSWAALQGWGPVLAARAKDILLAAWALFSPPYGPEQPPAQIAIEISKELDERRPVQQAEANAGEITVLDTSSSKPEAEDRVTFVLVTSTCAWKGASSIEIECTATDRPDQPKSIDSILIGARSVLSEAPRILIIGMASCDGVNEGLADDRARSLRDRTSRAGFGSKKVIIISLGKFKATNCKSLADPELASQRPILIGGLYGNLRGDQLKALVRSELEQHATRLPQPASYSRFDLIE